MITKVASFAALLLASAAIGASTYKWVDAEGNVHYADQPVQGAAQVEVNAPGAGAEADAAANLDDKPVQTAAQVRAQQCDKAQKKLAEFQRADKIIQTDTYGRKTELSSEARVQAIVQAQRDVKDFCSPATAAAEPEPAPEPVPPAAETESAAAVSAAASAEAGGASEAGAGDSGGY